jgi:hypothetical protein
VACGPSLSSGIEVVCNRELEPLICAVLVLDDHFVTHCHLDKRLDIIGVIGLRQHLSLIILELLKKRSMQTELLKLE